MTTKNTFKGLFAATLAAFFFALAADNALAQVKIGSNPTVGYSSPKYATIPPKVRHLFLGKVRH